VAQASACVHRCWPPRPAQAEACATKTNDFVQELATEGELGRLAATAQAKAMKAITAAV